MKTLEEKLKNPVWHSLQETHKAFLIDYDGVQFYKPDICIFGAFYNAKKTIKALNAYSEIAERFFLVSENGIPNIDENTILLERKIEGCQLVLENLVDLEIENSNTILKSFNNV